VARLSAPWVTGIGIGAAVAVGVTALMVLRDDPKGPAESSADTTETDGDGRGVASSGDVRPPTGITVTLQRLVPGVPAANVGHPTSLVVQASGVAPLATVELWDGAALVATAAADTDSDDPTWQGVLDWVPSEVGATTLVARVSDRDGRSATSNALRLLTQEQQSPLPVRAYVTTEGETPASIIDQQGLGTEMAQLLFSDTPLDQPIPAGTELAIPLVDHLDQLPPADEPAPAPAPTSASDAVLPEVTADDDGCSASVRYEPDDAGRHTLVRLLPDSDLFQPVATDDASVFDDVPITPGTQMFAVETVNDGVRSTSPPVAIDGPDGCGGEWSGSLRVVHGVLQGVPDDIDRVYLYVGTGGAWRRVPAGDQSTIPRRFGSFLLASAMVDLSGAERVEIEGWGWRGAELVELGRSTFVPAPGFDAPDVVGGGGGARLSIVMPGETAGTVRLSSEEWIQDPGVQTFRWISSVAGTTHGIWQVLAFEPPAGASPLIAGVLAEGEVAGSGGDFTIDLGTIVGSETESTVALLPAYDQIAGPAAVDLVAALPAAPPPPGGTVLAEALAPLVPASQPELLLPPVEDLYIRVVPMVGDHWPGVATDDVVVHTGKPDLSLSPGMMDAFGGLVLDPTAIPFEMEATLNPPKPPNPGFANCWTFVTWRSDLAEPQKYGKQYAFWNQFLGDIGPDTPLCPGVCYSWYDEFGVSGIQGGVKTTFGGGSCSSGSGGLVGVFETIWKGATTLWDMFVGVFDTLKGVLVDIVVELSGCKAIGSQVADQKKAEAFCSTMATLAVNAALIYFGVPPTLPNSDQLKQAAKGELSALLVEAAKDLGIPCDEIGEAADVADKEEYTCESLAGELLDEVEKKLNEIFIQAAAASAGLNFPPGAVIRPAPQGQTTPPTVTVTVHPTAAAPAAGGMECPAILSVGAEWWPALSPVTPSDAALAAKNGMSGAYVPAGFIQSRLHGIPWLAKYTGPVTSLAVRELPTQELAGGTASSATRTYMLSPVPRSPVGAKDFVFANDPRWVQLPYHALQLHTGAKVQAEIFSACTGLYRATTTQLFGSPVAFQKVP
jgi:hypothetical protein